MSLRSFVLSFCTLAVSLSFGSAAVAHTTPSGSGETSKWLAVNGFDLLRDCAPAASRLATHGQVSARKPEGWDREVASISTSEKLAPHFVYETGHAGPVIEIAALGGGAKHRPGLAHMALGWHF